MIKSNCKNKTRNVVYDSIIFTLNVETKLVMIICVFNVVIWSTLMSHLAKYLINI